MLAFFCQVQRHSTIIFTDLRCKNPVQFAEYIFDPFLRHMLRTNGKRHAVLQNLQRIFIRFQLRLFPGKFNIRLICQCLEKTLCNLVQKLTCRIKAFRLLPKAKLIESMKPVFFKPFPPFFHFTGEHFSPVIYNKPFFCKEEMQNSFFTYFLCRSHFFISFFLCCRLFAACPFLLTILTHPIWNRHFSSGCSTQTEPYPEYQELLFSAYLPLPDWPLFSAPYVFLHPFPVPEVHRNG